MKTITRLAAGLLITGMLVSLGSCYYDGVWNCLRGNGVLVKEERMTGDFYGVVSEGSYEIEIIIDSVPGVEVEWDENLLPYVYTRISGDKLIIDQGTRKCLRSDYPAKVYVYTPSLNMVRLTGSGSMISYDMYTDDIKIEITGSGYISFYNLDALTVDALITGSGEIRLDGIAEQSDYTISGSGKFRAFDLLQDICVATISGSGDMEIYAETLLDAVISGSGNVFYKGTPRIIAHISGSGSVIDSN